MKKILIFFIFISLSTTSLAKDKNLYETFKEYPEIKIYLQDIKNKTGNPKVKPEIFREIFEKTMGERLTVKFLCVNAPEKADIAIDATIKRFDFKEKALPSFFSVAALAADMTAPKSAAKLIVDYELSKPDTGKAVFVLKNFTTDARKPIEDMKGDMAYFAAVEKNVNRFLYRAFYKQKE